MCIDYIKLNKATREDHFPLPFIDKMLECLPRHLYFCYLDNYSGFFQIPIHPDDQEKTTFKFSMEHLPTIGCHLDYAVLSQPFKDV